MTKHTGRRTKAKCSKANCHLNFMCGPKARNDIKPKILRKKKYCCHKKKKNLFKKIAHIIYFIKGKNKQN